MQTCRRADIFSQEQHPAWARACSEAEQRWHTCMARGDGPRWQHALDQLPATSVQQITLNRDAPHAATSLSEGEHTQLKQALMALHPWRKGPFAIDDLIIDAEWQSHHKWNRVLAHGINWQDRDVLDIGCGNGYYARRMIGAGAKRVCGVDPMPLMHVQFHALSHYLGSTGIDLILGGVEHLPTSEPHFDCTCSMGVLYHRRSPIDHLQHCRSTLRSGGTLLLETLVIDGQRGQVLVPDDRYAKMRNVWFIPSLLELEHWVRRCGFTHIQVSEPVWTNTDEQRASPWMTFESLADFLNPEDSRRTCEGHPAPLRAIITAQAP